METDYSDEGCPERPYSKEELPPRQGRPEFHEARHQAWDQSAQELVRRREQNPDKTLLEERMGCYAEELEPQVRAAVLELNRKG